MCSTVTKQKVLVGGQKQLRLRGTPARFAESSMNSNINVTSDAVLQNAEPEEET